ncbi:hypothetical protein LSAT2_031864, partial [Lamellibrachia satsuma]
NSPLPSVSAQELPVSRDGSLPSVSALELAACLLLLRLLFLSIRQPLVPPLH